MLAAYPIGFLFRFVPGQTAKHVYSIVWGLALLVLSLGPYAWLHSFVSALVTYVAVRALRPSTSLRFVFFFAFAYMSVSHIYRTLTDYMGWTLDFTGSQMIVTLKLISYAFNVKDAQEKLLTPVLDHVKDEKERASKMRTIAAIEVRARALAGSLVRRSSLGCGGCCAAWRGQLGAEQGTTGVRHSPAAVAAGVLRLHLLPHNAAGGSGL